MNGPNQRRSKGRSAPFPRRALLGAAAAALLLIVAITAFAANKMSYQLASAPCR